MTAALPGTAQNSFRNSRGAADKLLYHFTMRPVKPQEA